MARERTYKIAEKIKSLFGGTIPDLERLSKLDTQIWELKMLRGEDKKLHADMRFVNLNIFGYSKILSKMKQVDIDEKVFERIIDFYEEEYEKQAKVCEDIIAKMERR